MASENQHITQAKRNLLFLSNVNKYCNSYWDWQITISFYVAVHLVNAHIFSKIGKHFEDHSKIMQHIDCYSNLPSRLPENILVSFRTIRELSRKSRYLKGISDNSYVALYVAETDLARALLNLDSIMKFYSKEYNIEFKEIKLDCHSASALNLRYFKFFA